jgi:hypothetical protein
MIADEAHLAFILSVLRPQRSKVFASSIGQRISALFQRYIDDIFSLLHVLGY